jgi:nicotinate-nucleotide adenylyltransferase
MKAIFGGTFDPIHLGHIKIAEEVSKIVGKNNILICPTGDNAVHKKPSASFFHRVTMCKIAFENFSENIVSEIDKDANYTYNLLAMAEEKFNEEVCFITGTDTNIRQYYLGDEILKKYKIIFFQRGKGSNIPDYSSTEIRRDLEKNKFMLPENVHNYIKKNNLYQEK